MYNSPASNKAGEEEPEKLPYRQINAFSGIFFKNFLAPLIPDATVKVLAFSLVSRHSNTNIVVLAEQQDQPS